MDVSRTVVNIRSNLDVLTDLSAKTETIEKNLIQNILDLIAAKNGCLLNLHKLNVLKKLADRTTRYDSRRDITQSCFDPAYLQIKIGSSTDGLSTLLVFSHEVGHLIDCYIYNHPHPSFPEWIQRTAEGDDTAFQECYYALRSQPEPAFQQKEKEELAAYMVSLGVADACGCFDAARLSLLENSETNEPDHHAEPKRLLFDICEHYPSIHWLDKARKAMHLNLVNPELDVRALADHVFDKQDRAANPV